MLKKGRRPEKNSGKLTFGKVMGRIAIVFGVTVVIFAAAVGAAAYIIFCGPSAAACNEAVKATQENVLLSWIPEVFLSHDAVQSILKGEKESGNGRDGALITIHTDIPLAEDKEVGREESYEETEGLSPEPEEDDTEKGVRVTTLRKSGFIGKLIEVTQPENVILASPVSYASEGEKKDGMESIADRYEALWAVNAGSYGDGGTPEGCVISGGKLLHGDTEASVTLVGLDDTGLLHLGTMSAKEAMGAGIGNACACDSILILNGKPIVDDKTDGTGRGPMSAIGQKEDGTILMLAVDGWQAGSSGASREDIRSIMEEYGAKNAALLGCGAESGMMIDGVFRSAVPEGSEEAPASVFAVLGK